MPFLFWGLLFLGVALRCAQYLHNRELWPDEAYLALDIAHMSYRELAGPLHYHMTFPLGFLIMTKLVSTICGTSEYALRLLPLLSGLLSVFLFAALARRASAQGGSACGGNWFVAVIALAFFAFGKHLIYYSSEFRHYSIDLAAACFLYLLALPESGPEGWMRISTRRVLEISFSGAVLVWFSLASVFILAAMVTAHMGSSVFRKAWREALWTAAGCGVWGLSFCIHLYLLYQIMAVGNRPAVIHAYVESVSIPVPPASFADLRLWRDSVEHFFYFPGGLAAAGVAGFVFLVGCASLWLRNRVFLLMLLLPVPYILLATAFHQYPFRNQYLLFLTPCLFLVVTEGIGIFLEKPDHILRAAGVMLLVMLMAHPLVQSLRVFVEYRSGPGGDSVIKPLLAYAKANWEDGDLLSVAEGQIPMFLYYKSQFGFAERVPPTAGGANPVGDGIKKATYVLQSTQRSETGRVWVLSSPDAASTEENGSGTPGQQIDEAHSPSAVLRLYDADPDARIQHPKR